MTRDELQMTDPRTMQTTMSDQDVSRLTQAIDRLTTSLNQLAGGGEASAATAVPDALAYRWHRDRGLFARSGLMPIQTPRLISFGSLQNIDRHIERLRQNTLQFVTGRPANNVLMTGARGTGKSSLVRACLEQFHDQGLRLMEVEKQHLEDLPEIVALVGHKDGKYLVFCDDLSFEEGEHGYKGLKTVLDGSTAAPSSNVLVYATSNRRHMVNERASDNLERMRDEHGDMHPGDTVEEKVSLSDRFGLHLHFYGFTEDQYLAAASHWLGTYGIDLRGDDGIRTAALQWALERGARSGRVALQFAKDYAGRQMSAAAMPAA
ncbi:ATP-binding protein [Burkholderia gladioli]|nr:ATP-binding protein [Burkholderia gladioli]MDN7748950.1 ATP-binding protein [Burkholderia gladioli]